MRIRIENPDGKPWHTDITDADTGTKLKNATEVRLKISRNGIEASLDLLEVDLSLVADVLPEHIQRIPVMPYDDDGRIWLQRLHEVILAAREAVIWVEEDEPRKRLQAALAPLADKEDEG